MKKYFIRTISVLIFVAVVMYSIAQLSYLYRGEFSHTRPHVAGFYDEEKNSIDVIFSGASFMFCSFMPMEAWHDYGMTSYNFSINSMFVESYVYYVKEALKTQTPKLYVIDCGSFISGVKASNYWNFDNEDSESRVRMNSDALNYSVNRIKLINEIIQKEADARDFYFDILYYHDTDLPSLKYRGNKRHSAEKGYSALPLFSDEIFVNSDIVDVASDEVPLSEDINDAFVELLDELEKYDMEVLFVAQPNVYVRDGDDSKQGNLKYMERIVEERGFDFLDMGDYKDEIKINPTFDLSLGAGDHFTCFGAEKITRFLSKYIKDNYDLEDHRGDNKFAQWDNDYTEWEKILDGEKRYNSEFMLEVFTEECNKGKLTAILENADEYFVIKDNKVIDKYTGNEIELEN